MTTTTTELAPLNRIRVETALSRFPVHRLAKKGIISIDLQRSSDGVEADFRWKVSYNSDFGQPGPLAYKVDTLIVNRRIDEAGRPLPDFLKLGSLSSICNDLGISDAGPNISDLKRAFYQNASAFITAKIRYKTKSGRERWGEIGYTRYSVIFTGEALPDGRAADGVYLLLNPSFRDLLNHVEVRPLDYDYLVALSPGAQRLYELLSLPMYGALANGRPRVKLSYSEYCLYAPQTRYLDFEHVKKQMYKVHLPHRRSGYITKVEYQEGLDREGNRDWEIFYTPGPKAVAEYNGFTNRQGTKHLSRSSEPRQMSSLPCQATLDLVPNNNNLVSELIRRGITQSKATEMVAHLRPDQRLADQLEYIDYVIANAPAGKFHNPTGFYVRFIQDNIPIPATFVTTSKRQLLQQQVQEQDCERSLELALQHSYDEYLITQMREVIQHLPPGRYEKLVQEQRRLVQRMYPSLPAETIEEIATGYVRQTLQQSTNTSLLSFDEYRQGYSRRATS